MVVVLTLLTLGIYPMYFLYKVAVVVKKEPIVPAILGLFLFFVGAAWMQDELNRR